MDYKKWIYKNKAPLLFIGRLLLLYLALQLTYDYIISPYTRVDEVLIHWIIAGAENILLLAGYPLLDGGSIYEYHLGIQGTSGVIIGNPCDGLSLFILYFAFIIVFSGRWITKLFFILPGILLIHFLNVLRIVGLALIVKYYPDTLDFHHSYTFTLFVYAFIFLLWMVRIKFYQRYKK